MNATSHYLTSLAAVTLLNRFNRDRITQSEAIAMARASVTADRMQDLEFVHVRANRDDPHQDTWHALKDQTQTSADHKCLTALNHFLDVRKGPGLFDDYDGYSYFQGSACRDEFQPATELTSGWAYLLSQLTGYKVDQGLAFWFNDHYVHAPGHPWYQGCSPALARYAFPKDMGRYVGLKTEMAARFPLAVSRGQAGCGFPYSVFMPVDNMARYWFGRWQTRPVLKFLGPVLHAVQDASVPHHAAGCNGNWHSEYEASLDQRVQSWLASDHFKQRAQAMLQQWLRNPKPAPEPLQFTHRYLSPGRHWPIQAIVTWIALNAYHVYERVYQNFASGYQSRPAAMRRLLMLATVGSGLALWQARRVRHGE